MIPYSPILKSSQPAFISTQQEYFIYFDVPNFVNLNSISGVGIKVSLMDNDKNIVNNKYFPSGIIYKNIKLEDHERQKTVIVPQDLEIKWTPNTFYRIQMLFFEGDPYPLGGGEDPSLSNEEEYQKKEKWESEKIRNNRLSEWSTIMIIKAISKPEIYIANDDLSNRNIEKNSVIVKQENNYVEINSTPIFKGIYKCEDEDEDQYRFQLYHSTSQGDLLLEDSLWIPHTVSPFTQNDNHIFKYELKNTEKYKVVYSIQTVNGYEGISKPYTFLVSQTLINDLESKVVLVAEDSQEENLEDGIITIKLNSLKREDGTSIPLTGNYVLSRSDEISNFQKWEKIKYLIFISDTFENTIIYKDYTVESGVHYQYCLQKENSSHNMSQKIYNVDLKTRVKTYPAINLQYSFLFSNETQLKLKYNTNISSIKQVDLMSKQNPLGSKYPIIYRNGVTSYQEFSISGLISFFSDEHHNFLHQNKIGQEEGYYYKDEMVIPLKKYIYSSSAQNKYGNVPIPNEITDNMAFIEKKFRQCVKDFLCNGEPKLFRSYTQDNKLIYLSNVSLEPEETLNGLIYKFSAVGTEIEESSLKNYNKFGIIHIGKFSPIISINQIKKIGQISGAFQGVYNKNFSSVEPEYLKNSSQPTDLIKEIKKELDSSSSIPEDQTTVIKKIATIRVESYPSINLENEINELKLEKTRYLLNESLNKIERNRIIEGINKRIQEKEHFQEILLQIGDQYPIVICINKQEVYIQPGKIYNLQGQDIESLYLKYTMPIIINFSCYVEIAENPEMIPISIISSKLWGQKVGIFTNNPTPIEEHYINEKYHIGETDKAEKYEIFPTLSIFDIVKEDNKRQVEQIEGKKFYYNKNSNSWETEDKSLVYQFLQVLKIEIEADEYTQIKINYKNGTNAIFVIGSTEMYRLSKELSEISDIQFISSSFGIINYFCQFGLSRKKEKRE